MVSWTGVFMRPYYLRLNANGYYVVSFTNKETGTRTNYKSTHFNISKIKDLKIFIRIII